MTPRPQQSARVRLADIPVLVTAPAVAKIAVSGVTLDSRAVQPGDLYAALPGANTHGARFAADALAAGAAAILTDQDGEQMIGEAAVPLAESDWRLRTSLSAAQALVTSPLRTEVRVIR